MEIQFYVNKTGVRARIRMDESSRLPDGSYDVHSVDMLDPVLLAKFMPGAIQMLYSSWLRPILCSANPVAILKIAATALQGYLGAILPHGTEKGDS